MLDENEEFSVELTHKMGNAGILALTCLRNMEDVAWIRLYIVRLRNLPALTVRKAATVVAHTVWVWCRYWITVPRAEDEIPAAADYRTKALGLWSD